MTTDGKPNALDAIANDVKDPNRPPIHLRHPERSIDFDLVIAKNGDWIHEGRPIRRERMVKLFASLLRREQGEYFLITPPLKYHISVEEAPFLAVLLDCHHQDGKQMLDMTTNLGERFTLDSEHPIHVSHRGDDADPLPKVRVRDELDALISRAVFVELGNLAEECDGKLGVWSSGLFMELGRA